MRRSGILMPIFSLPSPYGIGTFGTAAYKFVDYLKSAGQTYWQILPLGPTSYGDSPYQTFSSFAGNPYFIDLDKICYEGLLSLEEIAEYSKNDETVDYEFLYYNRFKLLKIAFSRFKADENYSNFCLENNFWLDEYAIFMTLKNLHNDRPTDEWKEKYRRCSSELIDAVKKEHTDTVNFYKFLQYKFMGQWYELKNYANEKGIKIIGDIPIYVAFDSADVWGSPEQFLLDENLMPVSVAGCPPDAFSSTGQLWGNPLYNWENMAEDDYAWWKKRLRASFKMYDIVRIDHFRGFEAFYSIPFGSTTAETGSWVTGPGMKFFNSLEEELGDMPVIAEDLGFLTEGVREMLKESGFPGMKVLQFAFDTREESDYLPHNYPKNCVVYTGTHDNNTVLGWVGEVTEPTVLHAQKYLAVSRESIASAMMRAALSSVADTCILMMPDILGKDGGGRINVPSTLGGNWVWRMKPEEFDMLQGARLYELTRLYGRI